MARKSVKLYGHYTAQEFCERVGINFDTFTGEITDAFLEGNYTRLDRTHGGVYEWTNHTFTFTLFIKDYDVVVLHIRLKD